MLSSTSFRFVSRGVQKGFVYTPLEKPRGIGHTPIDVHPCYSPCNTPSPILFKRSVKNYNGVVKIFGYQKFQGLTRKRKEPYEYLNKHEKTKLI